MEGTALHVTCLPSVQVTGERMTSAVTGHTFGPVEHFEFPKDVVKLLPPVSLLP